MPIYQFGNRVPRIDARAWVAPGAHVIGKVQLDAWASIWFGAVLRADNGEIHIGEGSNIQDNCVVHNDKGLSVVVESYVTVGHQAILHSCHVGTGTLIGMQSILQSRSRIGKNSLVGAGSLVTKGQIFPDGVLIFGRPAKVIRELTDEELRNTQLATQRYIDELQICTQELKEIHV